MVLTQRSNCVTQFAIAAMLIAFTSSYSFISQPIAFPCTTAAGKSSISSNLTMKVSKGKSKHSKSNSLQTQNQIRKRLAGKPGSKHFMDPNKVFIGNLPFKATTEDVKSFLTQQLGNLHNIESVKIISDWKTGTSKGYGFINFMDPIYATSAIEIIKGKKLLGRVIRLDQGKRKGDDKNRVLFVKKRERRLDDKGDTESEDSVIDGALDEVEALDDTDEFSVDDFDDNDDDVIFGEGADEDSEFDGWFEDIYGGGKWEELSEEEAKNMNREQRREAQRMKPRKKLPHQGFGESS